MNFRHVALVSALLPIAVGCAAPTSEPAPSSDENVGSVGAAVSVTSYSFLLGRYGGTGGPNINTLECASSQDVVVGIYGRAGNVIDRVGLICARLNANGTFGPRYTAGSAGGNGGTPFQEECEPGTAAFGFDVYAATYVDGIHLICREPVPPVGGYYGGDRVGGYGNGSLYRSACPSEYLLRRLRVQSGNVVDSIQGRCWYVDPS